MSELPNIRDDNPFHRAPSLADLLAFDDLDFVRCAYVTILGRQPDPCGLAHNVKEVRAGTSKLKLLWRLRCSAEGQAHDPGIAGLDRALKRAAWERRPVLGALARFMRSNADGDARSDRVLRVVLNATARDAQQLRAIGERLNGVAAATGYSAPSAAPALGAADLQGAGHGRAVEPVDPAQTPELDHLRGRKVAERYLGHIAP